MVESSADSPLTEPFTIEGFRGEVSRAAGLARPDVAALKVSDPANAVETIHWGRNYLYSLTLDGVDGSIPAVVKLFRNQGWRRRLERRLKGSKAERSWSMALAMRARGICTPEPLLLLESERPDGPSIFVSRRTEDFVEARYLFRALRSSALSSEYPWVEERTLARRIGRTARQLHDAGFWHRDLSIGNLLIKPAGDGGLEVVLIDLNRARRQNRVSLSQRTRDLSRLGFYDAELEERFLEAYWEGRRSGFGLKRFLYRFYRSLYIGRVEGKKGLRGVTRSAGRKIFLRQPYAHIPAASADAGMRDKSVWDELSDQPHQHASRSERLRVRLADSASHLRAVSVAIAAAPRIRRRYQELLTDLWSDAIAWPGVGVGVGPRSGRPADIVAALEALGVEQALLRLHPWEDDRTAEEDLARALAARGVDLVFALPQVRDLVRDPVRWRSTVSEIGGRLLPYGNRFQIGQAINRSKWGLWNYREYVDLVTAAEQELRALGDVEILGPGVIDFEPHALAAALNYPGIGRLDTVSSLLYVDRRGAPENEQLGFDALDKATVFRAIADTARGGAPRYWITEFNWPLWEGPHSPAGRSVAVDEETQADYLVRYCIPILASGVAERVYWWQLVARGYGLLDPGEDGTRRRPAFHALATMLAELRETTCEGPTSLGEDAVLPVRAYRFSHPEKGEALVAWSLGAAVEVALPRPARRIVGRSGEAVAPPHDTVRLSGAPVYVWLEDE